MFKKIFALIICTIMTVSIATSVSAESAESYDLRTENQITSAKNQLPFGTCWDFAGTAAAESTILKQGLEDDIDLSEEAILWNACGNYIMNGYGWHNLSKNDGGYSNMVCGVLSSIGAYLESDVPYSTDENKEYYFEENLPTSLKTASADYLATDIVYVDTSNKDEIKEAIKNYGAVVTSWHDTGEYRDDIPAYWNPTIQDNNHSITVVGWDDNYPRENFLEIEGNLPKNNGAWLIKNSYGTDFGDNGYFWISYEDASLFVMDNVFYSPSYAFKSIRKIDDDTYTFQYDEFGAVSSIKDNDCMWANVYDFSQGKPYLNAVTFESVDAKGKEYSIYYAPVDEDGKPITSADKMTLLKAETVEHNGYTTVNLDSSFELPQEKGAVVISFSGETSIGIDTALIAYGRGKFTPAKLNSGESFQIKDGNIMDLGLSTQRCNITLKAVTSSTKIDDTKEESSEISDEKSESEISVVEESSFASESSVQENSNIESSDNKNGIDTGNSNTYILFIIVSVASAITMVVFSKKYKKY